ncbi:hypothetical protein [Methylophaga sp.]|uniref:hypothetical protein n=1 Tax=Methylophaga sp. TaxID=2024840 RepID=UPI003A916E00
MQENRKKWVSLGVALASGISLNASAADMSHDMHFTNENITVAAAGEGEGGGVTETDLKTNDVAFLTRLGLIRGHLLVGYELYKQGQVDMAITHMKHPRDELYAGLVPSIEYRGGKRFDEALSNLADKVVGKAPQDEVDEAYEQLEAGIIAAEAVAKPDLKNTLQSIKDLVRTAGEEYALGVENGKLINLHEYQDAYGFTQIAKRRLEQLPKATRKESADTVKQVEGYLDELADLWPSIAPKGDVDGDASKLYGAAARIEIAALSI